MSLVPIPLTEEEVDAFHAPFVPQQVLDPDTPEAKFLRPLLAQRDQAVRRAR